MFVKDLKTGDMIAFQIRPDADDGQINAGRWAIIKVLKVTAKDKVSVSLYETLSDKPHKVGWVSRPKPLIESRFPHVKQTRTGGQSTITLLANTVVDLPNAQVAAQGVKLNSDEKAALILIENTGHTGTFMSWDTLSMVIDHEDRAMRDADAWRADITRRRAEDDARFAALREREAQRLKGITLDQLVREVPFAEWDDRTAIIPPAYTTAARDRVHEMYSALSKLGAKPKRKDVRAELKACVEWFNRADGKMGYAIETEEREDIYRLLEEVCWACKQKPLLAEVDDWRLW